MMVRPYRRGRRPYDGVAVSSGEAAVLWCGRIVGGGGRIIVWPYRRGRRPYDGVAVLSGEAAVYLCSRIVGGGDRIIVCPYRRGRRVYDGRGFVVGNNESAIVYAFWLLCLHCYALLHWLLHWDGEFPYQIPCLGGE